MTNVAEVESDAAKLACEQALLFGRAKRAVRERVSEQESRDLAAFPLARLLFTISPKWRTCMQATAKLISDDSSSDVEDIDIEN